MRAAHQEPDSEMGWSVQQPREIPSYEMPLNMLMAKHWRTEDQGKTSGPNRARVSLDPPLHLLRCIPFPAGTGCLGPTHQPVGKEHKSDCKETFLWYFELLSAASLAYKEQLLAPSLKAGRTPALPTGPSLPRLPSVLGPPSGATARSPGPRPTFPELQTTHPAFRGAAALLPPGAGAPPPALGDGQGDRPQQLDRRPARSETRRHRSPPAAGTEPGARWGAGGGAGGGRYQGRARPRPARSAAR